MLKQMMKPGEVWKTVNRLITFDGPPVNNDEQNTRIRMPENNLFTVLSVRPFESILSISVLWNEKVCWFETSKNDISLSFIKICE